MYVDVGGDQSNSRDFTVGSAELPAGITVDADGDFASIGLPERSGSAEASATDWDAIIGVKGIVTLSENGSWIAPYRFDVGTGESKLTWQAIAGVGYMFDWGSTVLGWRYADYEMKSDATIQTAAFSGPMLGLAFQW